MKKMIWSVPVLVALLVLSALGMRSLAVLEGAALPSSACLQDQYGNKYNFTVDTIHSYVYGNLFPAQNTSVKIWNLTGSFVNTPAGYMLELTAVNPLGNGEPGVVPTFKVKGIYPLAAWYYIHGYGGQEFTWKRLGAATTQDINSGGVFGIDGN